MATEWSAHSEIFAGESGVLMQKLAACSECLLFPKADVQIGENGAN